MKKGASSSHITVPSGPETLLERLRLAGYHLRADCGGEGTCGHCRVRFISTPPLADAFEESWLDPAEIASGWRLACCQAGEAADLEYNPEWKLRFELESGASLQPGAKVGLAVDIGTTGLVAAFVDMKSGQILLTARGYNPQRAWGADVMTRLVAARDPATLRLMQRVILNAINDAFAVLRCKTIPPFKKGGQGISSGGDFVLAVGNTAMIHLAAGLPETTLSVFPFHSPLESQSIVPTSWKAGTLNLAGPVSGFVGSDLLAVLRSLDFHKNEPPFIKGGRGEYALVMDLGTNSEIALWDGTRYHVTSCAAGPAFEGGGISCGSPAGLEVAVDVKLDGGSWQLLPDDGRPKSGLCGSALIALLAQLVRSGQMDSSGKLTDGRKVSLQENPALSLTQKDVRSLQLAKGAIHTGITVLARRAGLPLDAISRIVITGAFARSLKADDLKQIGLIPSSSAEVAFINDGALRGAALALSDPGEPFADLRRMIRVVNLVDEPDFQDLFMAGLELKPMM